MMKYFFFLAIFLCVSIHASANSFPVVLKNNPTLQLIQIETLKIDSAIIFFKGDSVQVKITKAKKENTKLIAAILAFPIPFGFMGLHRIYLGAPPWIPVAYMVTLGGGMILPLLDFIAIICANEDELKQMENNTNLFMWVN
ncbi:MAG: TM2 domain-containing protein [Bacteroidetes bacterium]|nr:TM2 domain-containing protein [Bacteroidota bacterium]